MQTEPHRFGIVMFEGLINDRVTLVKPDGTISREDIPAHVQPKLIIIEDATVPLEVGDHILRKLENGNVEDFIVDDPAFYGKNFTGIKPHFQVKVRRNGSPSKQGNIIQSITNNFAGANSRVNIQSIDNSMNVSQQITREKLLEFLDEVSSVLSHLPDEQRNIIEAELVVLREESEKSEPSQMKTRGALQSIKSAAEAATGNLVASGILGVIANLA